jgi:hypothetical protein
MHIYIQWTQNNCELRWPLQIDTWEGWGDRKTIAHRESTQSFPCIIRCETFRFRLQKYRNGGQLWAVNVFSYTIHAQTDCWPSRSPLALSIFFPPLTVTFPNSQLFCVHYTYMHAYIHIHTHTYIHTHTHTHTHSLTYVKAYMLFETSRFSSLSLGKFSFYFRQAYCTSHTKPDIKTRCSLSIINWKRGKTSVNRRPFNRLPLATVTAHKSGRRGILRSGQLGVSLDR